MSGFTNIPNQLWDWQIDNKQLPNTQRIFALVVRYTVCFHREWHELSLSFIAERTGMLRQNVARDIKSMLQSGLIREKADGKKRLLGIGFENETVLESDNTFNEGVLKFDNTGVLKNEYQEINNIKLTNINNNDQTLFDRFWSCYPRKVSKPQAKKAFNTAMKKTDIETLILGLEHYKDHLQKTKTDEKFIKHPSTWLNAESWNDYKPAPPIQPEQSSILRIVQNQSSMEDSDRELIRKLYREREAKKDINCNRVARKLI